jgi:hypothetical protein
METSRGKEENVEWAMDKAADEEKEIVIN